MNALTRHITPVGLLTEQTQVAAKQARVERYLFDMLAVVSATGLFLGISDIFGTGSFSGLCLGIGAIFFGLAFITRSVHMAEEASRSVDS